MTAKPSDLTGPDHPVLGLTEARYRGLIEAVPLYRRLQDVAQANGVSAKTLKHWLKLGTMHGAPERLQRFTAEFARADMKHQRGMTVRIFDAVDFELEGVAVKDAAAMLAPEDDSPFARTLRVYSKRKTRFGQDFTCTIRRKATPDAVMRYLEQRWPVKEGEDDVMALLEGDPRERGTNVDRLLEHPPPAFLAKLTAWGWKRDPDWKPSPGGLTP